MTAPIGGFPELWDEAVFKYEKMTGRKLQGDLEFSTLSSLDDFDKEIAGLRDQFLTFRAHRRRILSALSKVIKPLEAITDVVSRGIGNTPFAPVAAVFGAVTYLCKACDSVSAAYDGLEGLFEDISDITVKLQGARIDRMDSLLCDKTASIFAYILEIVGMSEAYIKRKRFKQWSRAVFLKEDSIQEAITKLSKYIQSEVGLVIHLTYGHINDLRDRMENLETKLGSVADGMSAIREGFDTAVSRRQESFQKAISEDDRKSLTDYLATDALTKVRTRHEENLDSITKGTGTWLHNDPLFCAWQEEKAPLLWIFGKPGTGKTFLATKTVEVLQRAYPPHPDGASLTSVSYFYLKDDNPSLQDLKQMLKMLAAPIADANDRYKSYLVQAIKTAPSTVKSMWETLFMNFFTEDRSFKGVSSLAFLVIDGLDEAPEKERVQLLSCLASLISKTNDRSLCRVQVAIFARPSIQADPGFDHLRFQSREKVIQVTEDRTEKDISAFIKQRLRDINVLNTLNARRTPEATKQFKSLARQISARITEKSHGMFKWAGLMFDQIWRLQSPEAIIRALNNAPRGLHDMIHHTLRRLELEEPARVSYLRDLLLLVYCALRPLTLTEIWVLLFVLSGQHCYELEHDLQGRYASLFDIFVGQAELEVEEQSSETKTKQSVLQDEPSLFDDFDNISEDGSLDSQSEEHDELGQNEESERDALQEESAEDRLKILDPRWSILTASFSHASIRDFLEHEGSPSTRRWHDCSVTCEDWSAAHFSLAVSCIKLITGRSTEKLDVDSLKEYSKLHYMKHLELVDLTRLAASTVAAEARVIADLFYNGQACLESSMENQSEMFIKGYGIRDQFVYTWFGTSIYSRKIREILKCGLEYFDDEQRNWAKSAAESSRELFKPFASACRRKWLTKTGWNDNAYLDKSEREVWQLYAYHTLNDTGENSNPDICSLDSSNYLRFIEPELLEAMASGDDIIQNEHYLTGIAWILKDADHPEAAIKHFEAALGLSSSGWVPMEGLALCNADPGRYNDAIDWMNRTIENLPQDSGLAFYMLPRISRWQLELGDPALALESARRAYNSSNWMQYGNGESSDWRLLETLNQYVKSLCFLSYFDDLSLLFRDLDGTATQCQVSLLVVFIRSLYTVPPGEEILNSVGELCMRCNSVNFEDNLTGALTRAIDYSGIDGVGAHFMGKSRSINIWLKYYAGLWKYRYGNHPEESVMFFESAIEEIDTSDFNVQQSQDPTRTEVAGLLSQQYFAEALAALQTETRSAEDGCVSSSSIMKMSELAKHKQGGTRYYRAAYPALLYGVWLRDHAKACEDAWRACFKPSVKHGIYLLGDDDPWNDQAAYCELGKALLLAGDTLNAGIAQGIALVALTELYESVAAAAGTEEEAMRASRLEQAVQLENNRNQTEEQSIAIITMHAESGPQEDAIANGQDYGEFKEALAEANLGSAEGDNLKEGQHETGTETPAVAGSDNNKNDNRESIYDDKEQGTFDTSNPKLTGFVPGFSCDGLSCQNTEPQQLKELWFCNRCNNICYCQDCVKRWRRNWEDKAASSSSGDPAIGESDPPISQAAADATAALHDETSFDLQAPPLKLPPRPRMCNPGRRHHEVVRFFPLTPEARSMVDALRRRDFEVQTEWLDTLTKEWE